MIMPEHFKAVSRVYRFMLNVDWEYCFANDDEWEGNKLLSVVFKSTNETETIDLFNENCSICRRINEP